MKRLPQGLLFLLFISYSTLASDNLKTKFIKLRDSVMPQSLEYVCGKSTYLIKKPLFGDSSLFIKENLDWTLLENKLQLKPAGFSLIAGNTISTVSLNLVDLSNIDLPIFNHNKIYERTQKEDYLAFHHNIKSELIPFLLTFDFYNSTLKSINASKFKGVLTLNERKYLKEQASRVILLDVARERQVHNERIKSLNKIIEKNQFPIEYEIEVGAIEHSEYCY